MTAGEAYAPILRETWWQSPNPPAWLTERYPGWHMGRSLSVCKALEKKLGWSRERLAGVLELYEGPPSDPMSGYATGNLHILQRLDKLRRQKEKQTQTHVSEATKAFGEWLQKGCP